MIRRVGWATIAAVCLVPLACGSTGAESTEVSAPATTGATRPTTTAPEPTTAAASTEADELPLYGTYLRRVPAVAQNPPAHPDADEWAISFESGKAWRGVLEVSYLGRKIRTSWGRVYRYSSDRNTLHLGAATRPKDVNLRLGGFECRPDEPATYEWSRFDRNRTLRLKAVQDPCAVRRAILEGDWGFYD
jgi:hypothetical protein